MNIREYKWLVVGFLCYIGVALFILGDSLEESTGLDMLYSLLWIATLLIHLWHYYQYYKSKTVYNIDQLFTELISYGLLSLGISFLPDVLIFAGVNNEAFSIGMELLGYYAVMNFLLMLFFSYKKLSNLHEDYALHQQWRPLLIVLAISCISYLLHFSIPPFLVDVIILTGLLMELFLIFKIKWIAFLNFQSKWLSIFFLFIINLLLGGMLQNVLSYDLPYLFVEPLRANSFFILIFIFILAYGVISIGGLLFNIPIASVTEQRAAEITSYQSINTSIMRKDEMEDTFKLLFRICYNDTKAHAGWLILERKDGEEDKTFYTNEIDKRIVGDYNKVIGLDELLKDKEALSKHHYFDKIAPKINQKYQSILVFPILTDDELLGTICLAKIGQESFDEYQIQLARSYVDQATLSFENTNLLKKAIESERYKQELNIARRVQKQLIPQVFPTTPFFEMDGLSESAFEVGGDYCDFIEMEDGRLSLIVADVAGHGASAAFYMAQLKGIYQALAQFDLSVEDFIKYTNDALANCLERQVFITLTYALFDFERKTLVYARAGHTPLLYYNNEYDKASFLEDEGMGLGILRNRSYNQYVRAYEQDFKEGDIFAFFTDGIVEGRNLKSREDFGDERLRMCIENHADTPVTLLKNLILQDFYSFIENTDRPDDHTLILVKIK